jgi:hypothetical protein
MWAIGLPLPTWPTVLTPVGFVVHVVQWAIDLQLTDPQKRTFCAVIDVGANEAVHHTVYNIYFYFSYLYINYPHRPQKPFLL